MWWHYRPAPTSEPNIWPARTQLGLSGLPHTNAAQRGRAALGHTVIHCLKRAESRRYSAALRGAESPF